jgi:putative hydrolase of the HAD superfamily
VNPEQDKIAEAVQILLDYEALSMVPRSEAVEVLSTLKQKGYKIGLISDCSANTIKLWQKTSLKPFFEVTIFSSAVGLKKPDPQIYQMATEQLKVKPEDCLYIGDGSSRELTGALKVGMHPVWICIPEETDEDNFRVDKENWDGEVISSLTGALNLVE